MSSQSISYDPKAPGVEHAPDDGSIYSVVMTIANGQIPHTLLRAKDQQAFKDAVIGTMVTSYSPAGIDNALNTLIARLRSMADNTSDEVRAYCEIVASLAYVKNDLDLAKKAILRVDPSQGGGVLRTIYSAIVERGIPASHFKSMIESNTPHAVNMWESLKN